MMGLLVILRGCIGGSSGRKGGRGTRFGGGNLSQPPVNFSKFLVYSKKRVAPAKIIPYSTQIHSEKL